MANKIGIVLSSGGLNSCVLACMVRQEHQLALLHVEFGHRSAWREKNCFAQQAERLSAKEQLVVELSHLQLIGGNARVDSSLAIEDSLALAQDVCNSFIPGLIPTMLGLAQSWAATIGAEVVFLGVSENLGPPGPATASLYPDYRREFYQLYNQLLAYATRPRSPLRVETPLISRSRGEIVRLGRRLDAPFELTWSCLRSNDKPCQRCYNCASRARGFAEAGLADPLLVHSPV
ncbi:MAG: 7-cyano-7-deazaguanine synthase [Phycisphaerae bacterium]